MGGILKVSELVTGQRRGVAFVCVGNSARSQMAEAFARYLGPSNLEIFSAGSEPRGVHPLAVQVMREIGIDMSSHSSKRIDDLPLARIAVAVVLCEEEQCPVMPAEVQRIEWPLPDPSEATGDEAIYAFRSVRDQVRQLVSSLF